MHALVVYESMYGNTHTIADRIGDALQTLGETRVVPVAEATPDQVEWADVVVVGCPTHAHSLPSEASRKGARTAAAKPVTDLHVDPAATGPGLRDWFRGLGQVHGKSAVAFDTRIDASQVLTGAASHGIVRRLRSHGFRVVAEPQSFLVTKKDQLVEGEADRAAAWASRLADVVTASS